MAKALAGRRCRGRKDPAVEQFSRRPQGADADNVAGWPALDQDFGCPRRVFDAETPVGGDQRHFRSDRAFQRAGGGDTDGGTVAARLIAAAEAEAKRRGASRFCWHTRAGTGMAAMLERRGYRPADVVVFKEI